MSRDPVVLEGTKDVVHLRVDQSGVPVQDPWPIQALETIREFWGFRDVADRGQNVVELAAGHMMSRQFSGQPFMPNEVNLNLRLPARSPCTRMRLPISGRLCRDSTAERRLSSRRAQGATFAEFRFQELLEARGDIVIWLRSPGRSFYLLPDLPGSAAFRSIVEQRVLVTE